MNDQLLKYATWKTIENAHCAFRGKGQNQQGLVCGHLFNVEPKCANNICPVANPNYLTFQREETTIFMVKKQSKDIRIPTQAWSELELKGSKNELIEQIDEQIDELKIPLLLSQKAIRKFERIFDLIDEIKTGLEQAEIEEDVEDDSDLE